MAFARGEITLMSDEQLLQDIELLFRQMPERSTLRHNNPENPEWFGRAAALLAKWDHTQTHFFNLYHTEFLGGGGQAAERGLLKILALLHRMRADLVMKARGPGGMAIDSGRVHDYFDEVRKIIETARQDVFFVDPYLDADFVAAYLPYALKAARIRLLTRYKLATLVPAVRAFAQQEGKTIEVRSSPTLHDRFVLVDGNQCYQSGASFKDGGRLTPTTLTPIIDALDGVRNTYETLWANSKVEA
jgi:hypothetical protein